MDGCLLCLEINKEFGDCIKVDSTQWEEHNIKNLIEKHLWIMESISASSWLCQACWQALYDFHKFYTRIEEAHMDFGKLMPIKLKPESKDHLGEGADADNDDKNDLFEPHLEPEILVMEDHKTTIKKEPDEDSEEDNLPLKRKRRRHSKETNNDKETSNQDPLKNSKKSKKSSKSKSKKKDSCVLANTLEVEAEKLKEDPDTTEKQESEELKQDPENFENQDLSNVSIHSSDCEDFDLNTDFDCPSEEDDYGDEDKEEPKQSRKKRKKRKPKSDSESIESDSDNSISDENDYKPENGSKKTKTTKKKRKPAKKKSKNSDSDYENNSGEDKGPKRSTDERNKFLAENFKMTCVLCDIPMPDFRTLYKHFQSEHKERGYAVCCNKKFFDRCKLLEHVERHVKPNDFKCNECGKLLLSRKTLQIHQLSHLPEDKKKFTCTKCGKNFAEENLLTVHMHKVHFKHNYKRICDKCGKYVICGEAFQRHMLEHEGKTLPTVRCDICGLHLTSRHGLGRHKRVKHPVDGKKDYVCDICMKVSPNIRALRKHISDTHTATILKCSMCDRGFKRPLALKEHMATHTGIALYTCPWCPKTFNANGGLHAHRKRQHPVEWEEARRQKHLERYKSPDIEKSNALLGNFKIEYVDELNSSVNTVNLN